MTCWLELPYIIGHSDGPVGWWTLSMLAGFAMVGLVAFAVMVARRRESSEVELPSDPAREAISCTEVKAALLTPSELSFYRLLEPLVSPRCLVFAKVRLADLFGVQNCPFPDTALRMLRGKRIDFVLCDPSTFGVMAAIELDENASAGADRVERQKFIDDLFASNGLPLLRVPQAASDDVQLLKSELARHELLPSRAGSEVRRMDPAETAGV